MKNIEPMPSHEAVPFSHFLRNRIEKDQKRVSLANKMKMIVKSKPKQYFLKYEGPELILFHQFVESVFGGTIVRFEEIARLSQLVEREELPKIISNLST